jgi:hypothetical protein
VSTAAVVAGTTLFDAVLAAFLPQLVICP